MELKLPTLFFAILATFTAPIPRPSIDKGDEFAPLIRPEPRLQLTSLVLEAPHHIHPASPFTTTSQRHNRPHTQLHKRRQKQSRRTLQSGSTSPRRRMQAPPRYLLRKDTSQARRAGLRLPREGRPVPDHEVRALEDPKNTLPLNRCSCRGCGTRGMVSRRLLRC
jgi:hypothetical protein